MDCGFTLLLLAVIQPPEKTNAPVGDNLEKIQCIQTIKDERDSAINTIHLLQNKVGRLAQ